ncbi:RNA-directed DNA polymerase from mobile element jockey [Trichonephila clavipes]|nr:RNA-directed DNA polymerase from mobile element jockey [Trichonephila clavipes]
MFADDTAVISQNKRFSVVISNLQHYISSLELWLNDWKIKVNASKSACLMFTRRSRLPVGLTPVTIFGQPVPWVNVARYLGLFLDAKLTFAYHIEQTRKKALAVHAMLKRLISRRSKLAIRHKVLLYKSIIRLVMCYGSQIFGSAGMCHLKKLHTLTNSFLRQLVNAPWFVRNEVIYRDLKIKPFLPHIKDLSKRFFDKLPSVPNELITNQPAYDPAEPSSQKRPRALLEHEFINFPQAKRLRRRVTSKCLTAFRCHSFTLSVFKSHHVVQTSASSTLSIGCYGWKGRQALLSTGECWSPTRSFQSIQIRQTIRPLVYQGKDVLPAHNPYPIMTQKSKLVTPDVVFNILNAKLSSLATSFAIRLNAGSALVEKPSNLFVESFKTSPVLHVQDSPVPNSILVRLWVQTFIQKVQNMRRMQNGSKPSIQMVYESCLRAERLALPAQRPERMPTSPVGLERIPTPPAEPERPPFMDPSVFMENVEVTPPLIPRCDKGTQTLSPYLHVKCLDFGKRRMEPPLAPKRLKQEPSEG